MRVSELFRGVWWDLRVGLWPLLVYDLFFKALAAVVVIPIVSWAVTHLITVTGRISVSNDEIVAFVLSPLGLVWLILVVALAEAVSAAEWGGMMLIASAPRFGQRASAFSALWGVVRQSPRLLALGCVYVGAQILVVAPFIGAGAAVYHYLLGSYDINYLIVETPPVWWIAVSIGILLAVVALVAVTAAVLLPWMLVLPVLLLETGPAREAVRRSRELIRRAGLRTAGVALACILMASSIPVLLALLFDNLGELVFANLPESPVVAIPALVGYVAVYIVFSAVATFLAVAGVSLLITRIYAGARTAEDPDWDLEGRSAMRPTPRGWGATFTAVVAAMLLIALVAAVLVLNRFDLEDRVEITAHRGSSLAAPENTLSALAKAMEDRAEWAEIDVQLTADDEVVLLHDDDLLRIARDPRKPWQVRYEEIRDLDVGSWFRPQFAGERIPTLRQAVALVRDRMKLNIELKFSAHKLELADRVVEILHQEDFASQVVITSLSYSGLQRVRELDPHIRIGYIVYQAIGNLTRLNVDFFSVSRSLVNGSFITSSQKSGREVHVWTVNKRGEMSRLVDLGADNIITDVPKTMRELLDERAALSDEELLLLKVRSWLWREAERRTGRQAALQ